MITTTETITPAIAAEFLTHNTKNRFLNEKAVALYARQMKDGDWLLSPQGLSFFDDGTLCDGQHRLHAVVRSGCAVQFQVTRGVSHSVSLHVDMNKARTAADCLKIDGNGWANLKTVSIINQLALLDCYKTIPAGKLSTDEIKRCYESSSESIDFVCQLFKTNVAYLSSAPVKAAFVIAHANGVEENVLSEFCQVLYSGMGGEGCSAIIRLRDMLITKKHLFSGALGRKKCVDFCMTAINHFDNGRDIKSLRTSRRPYDVEAIFNATKV